MTSARFSAYGFASVMVLLFHKCVEATPAVYFQNRKAFSNADNEDDLSLQYLPASLARQHAAPRAADASAFDAYLDLLNRYKAGEISKSVINKDRTNNSNEETINNNPTHGNTHDLAHLPDTLLLKKALNHLLASRSPLQKQQQQQLRRIRYYENSENIDVPAEKSLAVLRPVKKWSRLEPSIRFF